MRININLLLPNLDAFCLLTNWPMPRSELTVHGTVHSSPLQMWVDCNIYSPNQNEGKALYYEYREVSVSVSSSHTLTWLPKEALLFSWPSYYHEAPFIFMFIIQSYELCRLMGPDVTFPYIHKLCFDSLHPT
jgi:hypothetical protein